VHRVCISRLAPPRWSFVCSPTKNNLPVGPPSVGLKNMMMHFLFAAARTYTTPPPTLTPHRKRKEPAAMGQEESTMQSTTTMTTASFAADPTPLEIEKVRRMAYYGT